jgi:hypothetical protein
VPSTSCSGSSVCRMHGAGGGPPKGNRNALKHGDFTAETLALKRQISALARMARETIARSKAMRGLREGVMGLSRTASSDLRAFAQSYRWREGYWPQSSDSD